MNWREKVESLTTAQDHLNFVDDLIKRKDVSTDLKKQLLAKTNLVRDRLLDESLRIVIVGEASTGKTTFINALLRDVILKSHILTMTTSLATEIRYGKDLAVEIVVKGSEKSSGQRERYTEADGPVLFEGAYYTLKRLIELVTTSDDFAEKISSFVIYHPSEFLKNGIVIIDTPGADANNEKHKVIAQKAADDCDTAIIITPAAKPVSKWLLELFQEDFLFPFLHRCLFMVTKVDELAQMDRKAKGEEAVELVFESVRTRLKKGLSDLDPDYAPRMYYSAAQAVIDDLGIEDPIIQDLDLRGFWKEKFQDFQRELIDYLTYQRADTIAKRVLGILKEVFQELDHHFELLWQDYENRRGRVEDITRDIASFCNNQSQRWEKRMKRKVSGSTDQFENDIYRIEEKATSEIEKLIFGASDMKELKSRVESNLGKKIQNAKDKVQSTFQGYTVEIKQEAEYFKEEFKQDFQSIYHQLELLETSVSHSNTRFIDDISMQRSFSISDEFTIEDISIEGVVGGVIAGAIIGSIIPFVGTLFGAIAGGLYAMFGGGPSLDDQKGKVWLELRPKLNEFFDDLRIEATKELKSYGKAISRKVKTGIEEHEHQYQGKVDKMRTSQIQEKTWLKERQIVLRNDLNQLKKKQAIIQEQADHLRLGLSNIL